MMEFEFDLQLFADDVTEDTDSTEAIETEAPATGDIPEELEGIPEDIAKNVMAEAGITADHDADDEDNTADGTSDNKEAASEPVLDQPKQKVPYDRFKQQVDKVHSLEEQLAELKQQQAQAEAMRLQANNAGTDNQNKLTVTKPNNQQNNGLKLTDEAVSQIEAMAQQKAMEMTGLSQDDVDALEYTDEDDKDNIRFKTAKEIAKANLYDALRTEVARREQEAAAFMERHNAIVNDYVDFSTQEGNEPDFAKIQQYATGDFFNSKADTEKAVIMDAYDRVLKNIGSPQDYFVVKNYYIEAKTAYRAKSKKNGARTVDKVSQANKLPRSEQVTGTATSVSEGVSADLLQRELSTMKWEDIPDAHKEILLRGEM